MNTFSPSLQHFAREVPQDWFWAFSYLQYILYSDLNEMTECIVAKFADGTICEGKSLKEVWKDVEIKWVAKKETYV